MEEKSYVYDGREVVLTGRCAEKKSRAGRTKKLYEIRPKDVGGDYCNKWVEFSELFEIMEKIDG